MNSLERLKSLLDKNLFILKTSQRELTEKDRQDFLREATRESKKRPLREDFQAKNLSYFPKPNFLGEKELNFFHTLEFLVGERYYIVPQVHLSHIMRARKKLFWEDYNPDFTKINSLSLDFVLFNKPDFTFKLAIELDDSTHDWPHRIRRDAFVEAIMKKAKMKLVRMNSFNLEKVLFYL